MSLGPDDNWEISLATAKFEQSSAVYLALKQVLDLLFADKINISEVPLIPTGRCEKRLIIIPSDCTHAIKSLFGELIITAYGQSALGDCNQLHKNRFLFVECGPTSLLYEGLVRILEHLKVARNVPPNSVLPTIVELVGSSPEEFDNNILQNSIESICFPSGAAEMQEIFFRNTLKIHDVTRSKGKNISDQLFPALRLLIGAYTAGDITKEVFLNALKRLQLGIDTNDIEYIISEIERDRVEGLQIGDDNKSSISTYLKGRRILLIEDKLSDEGWNIVLPAIVGSFDEIVEGPKEYDHNGVYICHAKNVKKVLNWGKRGFINLSSYDLILLDLHSTDEDLKNHSGHVLSDISGSIRNLVDKLAEIRKNNKFSIPVPVSFPKIVVFSGDSSGLTTRTMIKELDASDYFFKTSIGDSHKTEYYSTFRNSVISALKENVADILALPGSSAKQDLDQWLGQFLPADRPHILRIMKHFRYYSAMSIVNVLDQYLQSGTIFKTVPGEKGLGSISLFDAKSLPPNKYIFSSLGRANKSGPATLALLSKSNWLKSLHKLKELQGYETKKQLPVITSSEGLAKQIFKSFDECKELVVVLMDDFIGSGGQVVDYVSKAVHSILEYKGNGKTNSAQIKKAIFSPDANYGIYFHVLYAVGLKSDALTGKIEQPNEDCTSGVMKTSKHKNANNKECDFCNDLSFELHIADLVPDLKSVCKDNSDLYEKIYDILRRNLFITKARQDEYPCQFEPLGWKSCGGLVATYANAPGNTLPIIWAEGLEKDWIPLFPRYFNPWDEGSAEGRYAMCDGSQKKCFLLNKPDADSCHQYTPQEIKAISEENRKFPCWAKDANSSV